MGSIKFGCLRYDYESYPYYSPSDVNLGDYIQSLAASQYLPRLDFYLDRDKLFDCPVEHGRLIANGWYCLNDSRHLPSSRMDMLLTSVHVNNVNDTSLSDKVLDYLRHYSRNRSIGCRDYGTLNFLQAQGVEAYFSSCLTTTLRREDFTTTKARHGVILSDISKKWTPFPLSGLPFSYTSSKHVRKILDLYKGERVTNVTHVCPKHVSHRERFEMARALLNKYANAKLVITSRIHAALPCLGLGTPVIYIGRYDALRFKGLDKLFNHIWLDKDGSNAVNIDKDGFIANGTAHIGYAEALRTQCREFINGGL